MNSTNQATVSCTPIYLNICSSSTFNSVPANYAQTFSYKYPRTGSGMYINVFYCNPVNCNTVYNRDYLRGRIRVGLVNGKQYCGKYYVSLYQSMKFGTDRLGAYLDNGALDVNSPCLPIVVTPTWENPTFNYIIDTAGWTAVQGVFTANGTETYITIGNFYSHANTHTTLFSASNTYYESYYYVDDVSIIATDITAFAGNDATICVSDSIHLGRPQEIGLECLWYKPTIATAFANTSDIWFKPTQAGVYTFVQRMDNCAITWDTVNVTVIQDCASLLPTKEIPNVFTPNGDGVNDVFTFSVFSAKGLVFNIYDRWGLLIKNLELKTNNYLLWDGRSTSGIECNDGVYFYTLNYKLVNGDTQTKKGFITLIR